MKECFLAAIAFWAGEWEGLLKRFFSTANNASGSLATFTSRTILPALSTMQMPILDRNVQSSKMVHAALLLLMLEAVFTDLVSPSALKRSTQNLQLSTSCRPITPSFAAGLGA